MAGFALAAGGVVFALVSGSSETRRPAGRPEAPSVVQTPAGSARVQLGSLDRQTLKFAAAIPGAYAFVGSDADGRLECLVVALQDAEATTGAGCRRPGAAVSSGQFVRLASSSRHGAVVVAYRSLRPILSATVDGKPRTPRNGVVLVDVPRNSRATLRVRAAEGTFMRTIVSYDSLATEVSKPVRPGEG
jgi:hypothetical protein